MASLVRGALTAIVFVATYFFVFWLPGAFLPGLVAFAAAIVCAVLAARTVWFRTAESGPDTPLFLAGLGALVVGGIGFVAGFFGPMIFAPDANQGPMLGLFITGPGGALLGAIGGFLVGLRRRGAASRSR